MKVFYSPEMDSLSIKLQTGDQEIAGEIMGEDLNENAGLHRDDAVRYRRRSRHERGLRPLTLWGRRFLPVGLSSPVQQESKAG